MYLCIFRYVYIYIHPCINNCLLTRCGWVDIENSGGITSTCSCSPFYYYLQTLKLQLQLVSFLYGESR